jgi:hypothetical protein
MMLCHTYGNSALFSEMWIKLNQTNDGEDATELSIAKDEWGQLKAGISFQEYVSWNNDAVTCEVQTLQKIMDEKFTSGMSGGGRWKKK